MRKINMKLLTTANAKTVKGEKFGWLTGILYLAPAKISGHNVCPWSDKACRTACLFTAGRGKFKSVSDARTRKTKLLFDDRAGFIAQLVKDIEALVKRAKRLGLTPAVRLNGTSDLPWHTKAFGEIPQRFPNVVFYDYTKDVMKATSKDLPKNYHLTFSRSSCNDAQCMAALKAGVNVAVVFDEVPVGGEYWGHKVVSGEDSDLRFLDGKRTEPVIVGLPIKGAAAKDVTGFVVRRAA